MLYGRFVSAALIFAAISNHAMSSPMIATETGNISGSLNGVLFSNAAVTFTTVGDTSNQTSLSSATIANYIIVGTTTVAIAGFSTATFTGSDQFGILRADYSTLIPGYVGDGIVDTTTALGVLMNLYSGTFGDLSMSSTSTGLAYSVAATYSTDLGALVLTAQSSGVSTFTETVQSVPEPTSIAILGSSVVGLIAMRRRKQRT